MGRKSRLVGVFQNLPVEMPLGVRLIVRSAGSGRFLAVALATMVAAYVVWKITQSPEQATQFAFNGLSVGAIYALLAIEFTLVYSTVRFFDLYGAAVRALSQMGPEGGKSLLMSTSPQAPLLVVNGPIAEDLGINARSALGPGFDNRVNIVVGRTFSMCMRNIGHWYPNKMDMDTIGTTRKFVLCIAENEKMSPWQPYHVDKGFDAGESAVSIFITNGELDVQDQGNDTAEGLLKTVAYGATFGTRGLWERHSEERLILLPPDVARPVGAQGFTKRGAKEFIHMHASASLGKMTQYVRLEGEARGGALEVDEGPDRAGAPRHDDARPGERRAVRNPRSRGEPCQDAGYAQRAQCGDGGH